MGGFQYQGGAYQYYLHRKPSPAKGVHRGPHHKTQEEEPWRTAHSILWKILTSQSLIKLPFDYVQEEMARRKKLGALANKSLNTCCFTGKIKCPHCGVSYMHNKRTDRGSVLEFWCCGSRKKKGGRCEVGGSINHEKLKQACAEVLGLTEFDEDAFLEQVDVIYVPKRYVLEFSHGRRQGYHKGLPQHRHKDCWTAEYRAKTSAKRKRMAQTALGASGFTGKLKM